MLNSKPNLATPPDLRVALTEAKALKKFETMVFTRKKEYLTYVAKSKSGARTERIAKVVSQVKWGR